MHWAPLLRTRAEGWTILVRLMVGLVVFLPEGIQKLAFPEILGAGRFGNMIAGAGAWSLDAMLARERSPQYRRGE
jgi:hypothetical protein